MWQHTSVKPALGVGQEDQEFKTILSYTTSSWLAWATWDVREGLPRGKCWEGFEHGSGDLEERQEMASPFHSRFRWPLSRWPSSLSGQDVSRNSLSFLDTPGSFIHRLPTISVSGHSPVQLPVIGLNCMNSSPLRANTAVGSEELSGASLQPSRPCSVKVPRCQYAGKQTQEQGPAFLPSPPSDLSRSRPQPSPLFLGFRPNPPPSDPGLQPLSWTQEFRPVIFPHAQATGVHPSF